MKKQHCLITMLLLIVLFTSNVLGGSKEEFVKEAIKEARVVKDKYGIPISATVAQSIYESNYGKSPLAVKYHNYHGIKVGEKKYKGDRASVKVKEQGKYIVADFRAYDSMRDGFLGYASFLSRPRYKAAFGTHDGLSFVKTILRCGFCPDSQYLNDIKRIMDRHNLRKLDS